MIELAVSMLGELMRDAVLMYGFAFLVAVLDLAGLFSHVVRDINETGTRLDEVATLMRNFWSVAPE